MATNTAASFTTHTANGNTDSDGKSDAFNISFSYLAESEIDVTVGTDTTPKTLGTHYEFASATTIKFLSGHVPSNGTAIKFQRDTDISAKKVDFQDGSVLTETDLDNNSDQILFGLQEFVDILNNDTLKRDGSATVTGNFVFEGATDDAHETTLAITDPTADRTITLPNATGNVVLDSATQTLTNKTITATAFTSSNVDINGGAIDGTPIGANSTSTGAFTTATIATGNITTGNITTGNITTGNTTNLTNTQKLKINSGTTSDDGDGTYTVSGGHLTIGSSDANALQLFHDSGNSNSFISEVGTGDLVIVTNGTNLFLQKDATSGHAEDFIQCIANGAVKVFHDSQPKLTTLSTGIEITGNLDSDGITGDSVVTSGTSTSDTKVYSAKRTGELFYGKDTVGEIQSGETWSSADDKVATTAAIDARVIDLVDDVGGFVPIASETVFPNANPDVNNGTGTLISIKEIGSSRTPSGGTVTISNGNAANNATITITGCGSTVLTAGFGAIVETTSTLHTYTFHRLTPKATEVTTVASISSNVTTVAGISSNVTTVAGISSNVTAVAGKTTELTRLGTTDAVADMALLGTTDAIADMNTLGTSSNVTNMNTLAGISSNITTVAGISSNVTTVANDGTDIGLVAGSIGNVNTTAGSIANLNTVAGSIANVNTVGTNITNVTNASNYLNNFLQLYLGEASSNPTADGLGNALTEGDLYFNTVDKRVRVFNGSVFANVGEGAVEVAKFATAAFNTLYTASAGSNSIDLGGLAITGAVFANEAIAGIRASLAKGAGTYNLGGI